MSQTLAYIRASTDKQDAKNQRHEILEYANKNKTSIDEFIEITISSRKNSRQRRIEELTHKLKPSDTLMVTELSRLGRSTGEVILLIKQLAEIWGKSHHHQTEPRVQVNRRRKTWPRRDRALSRKRDERL